MKHAIILTGGKQYRVAEGDVVFVEKLDASAGDSVKFDQVLAVIDGENAVFGKPVIEGASVSANVVKNGKAAKIRVYKMKPKKGYRRTQGHRQPYTKVQIEAINAPGNQKSRRTVCPGRQHPCQTARNQDPPRQQRGQGEG